MDFQRFWFAAFSYKGAALCLSPSSKFDGWTEVILQTADAFGRAAEEHLLCSIIADSARHIRRKSVNADRIPSRRGTAKAGHSWRGAVVCKAASATWVSLR
jgi:hypothetical protein